MVFEIQFYDSPTKQRFEVHAKKCIIGRSKNSDLQIDRDGMSRKHLEVEWDGKEFYVTDLNSTNGVYVNSERIPPGARTIYKNFLPLEIADKITIFVYSDEQIAAEEFKKEMDAPVSNPSRESANSSGNSSNSTRTMRMDRPSSSSSKKSFPPKKKTSSPLVPILIIIIGGGAYYHFSQMEKVDTSTAAVENKGNDKKSGKKKSPTFSENDEKLERHLKEKKCEGLVESALCTKFAGFSEKEGITIHQDQLVISINTALFSKKIENAIFNKLKASDKLEYILASFATRPWLVEEAVKAKINNILVVGFEMTEGATSLTGALSVTPLELPEAKEADQEILFNNIFNAGIFRPYKVFYKPHTSFKSFLAREETPPAPADVPPTPSN